MMMIGTIIGEIRIAMIRRRYGISDRDRPRAASVPRTVARMVDQRPMMIEFFAALIQVEVSQACAHQAESRTPSGAGMPSVSSESYQRSE